MIITPSELAHDFLRSTCGSVSGSESGYMSESTAGANGSYDEDSFLPTYLRKKRGRDRQGRQMTIYASPSPPHSPHKDNKTTPMRRALFKADTAPQFQKVLPVHGHVTLSPSYNTLGVNPTRPVRSKSPLSFLWSPKRNKSKIKTLNPQLFSLQREHDEGLKERTLSCSYEELATSPTHVISSPIHKPTGRPLSKESSDVVLADSTEPDVPSDAKSPLQRTYVIKRKTLHHLGVKQLLCNVSLCGNHS